MASVKRLNTLNFLHASIAQVDVVEVTASDLQVSWIPTYLDPVIRVLATHWLL